jgi:hypothetical protein
VNLNANFYKKNQIHNKPDWLSVVHQRGKQRVDVHGGSRVMVFRNDPFFLFFCEHGLKVEMDENLVRLFIIGSVEFKLQKR